MADTAEQLKTSINSSPSNPSKVAQTPNNVESKKDRELTTTLTLIKESNPKLAASLEPYTDLKSIPSPIFIELLNEIAKLYQKAILEESGRQLYRLQLKIMMTQFMDEKRGFFKIQEDLKNDSELLLEVMHTVMISFSEFYPYFKYKNKDAGTDYRVPVRRIVFEGKDVKETLDNFLASSDFNQTAAGHERIVISRFPKLSAEEFNELCGSCGHHFRQETSPVVRRIILPQNKEMILFLRNFNTPVLDLHGFSMQQALKNAKSYLRSMFLQFKNKAALITGKGKHSKNKKGTLKDLFLVFLKKEQEQDPKFIKNFHYRDGQIFINFQPPVEAEPEAIAKALADGEHRILVKQDKKCEPKTLEERATLLNLRTVLNCRIQGLVGEFVPQHKEPSQHVKLVFCYGKKNMLSEPQSYICAGEGVESKRKRKKKK